MLSVSFEFEAIGTHWKIDLRDDVPEVFREELLAEIRARIEAFDHDYSRFRSDSLVSAMAQAAGTYMLPPDADPMLSLYERLYHVTDGLVTPLVGQLLEDAGYDAAYSLVPKALRPVPTWEETLEYRFPQVTLKKPALLDVGAFGKGYLIDIVGELLEKRGIRNYVVDAGGDIRQRSEGGEALRIGLEHPLNPSQVIGVVSLANRSVCGSAGNRRAWQGFHHIMNPKTRTSTTEVLAVWTVAETTLLADAMSTCLFFVPPSALAQEKFEYVVVRQDLSAEMSPGFPGELFRA